MGIRLEFNPDLALRNISEFKAGRRKKEECIPETLKEGKVYPFLKEGQRMYWFGGEFALIETKGNERLSAPIASVQLLETTCFLQNGRVYTKGKYKVVKVIPRGELYFNWMAKA